MLEFYLEGKKNTLRNLREFIQNKDSFSEDERCRYLQFINDSERKYLEETERNKILNDYINSRGNCNLAFRNLHFPRSNCLQDRFFRDSFPRRRA